MKNIVGLLLIASVALCSCNNQQTKPKAIHQVAMGIKQEIEKLNSFLSKYDEPSQKFKVLSNKPFTITGKQGTIIAINPDDFLTANSEPIGKYVEVELKELANQSQLLKANTQTVSDNHLLVSGGAYYINLTSQGKPLKLKEGKSIRVNFPKLSERKMSLFYGQRDSLGKMNWQKPKEKFELKQDNRIDDRKNIGGCSKVEEVETVEEDVNLNGRWQKVSEREISVKKYATDTISIKGKKEDREKIKTINLIKSKVYAAVNIKSLGWINLDEPLAAGNTTDLRIVFNTGDSIRNAIIYLVYKDINSVSQFYFYDYDGISVYENFSNLPVGYQVRLIIVSVKKDKTLLYYSDFKIKENDTLKIKLAKTNDGEITKLFNF